MSDFVDSLSEEWISGGGEGLRREGSGNRHSYAKQEKTVLQIFLIKKERKDTESIHYTITSIFSDQLILLTKLSSLNELWLGIFSYERNEVFYKMYLFLENLYTMHHVLKVLFPYF